MVKQYCDVCEKEIKKGEMLGQFSSMEREIFGGKGNAPAVSVYDLCENCAKELKQSIAKMITEKKNEK